MARIRCLLGAALLSPTSFALHRPAHAADRRLYLDVVINGRDTGQVATFIQKGAALLATREDLVGLGLMVGKTAAAKDGALVDVSMLPHIICQIEERTQTLQVRASRGGVAATHVSMRTTTPDESLPVESSVGAVLNYDLVGISSNGQNMVSGVFDARVFSPYGVLDSNFLGSTDTPAAALVRLSTTYTYSDPGALRRYSIGDVITGSLSWTRPVQLGGLQITTDFALRPDLVTFPLPSLSAEAAVPSTVDVLVNGVRQMSQHVEAGPFDVPQIPVVNGSGNVSVVVQDALGRQVTETLPFYASPKLLAPGLDSFSAELGAVRRYYSVLSDDYSTPAGEFSFRHGLLPWLTVETHAEGTLSLAMGGTGAAFEIGTFGVVSLAGAASTLHGHKGGQYTVGFEHVSPAFSFSVATQSDTNSFRDLASVNGDLIPRMTTRASAGTSLGAIGSLGVGYIGISGRQQHTKLLTATYSRRLFGGIYGFGTGFHDFAARRSTGFLISFSVPIGRRSSISVGANMSQNSTSGLLQASQSTTDIGDVGWQVMAQSGQQDHEFGELSYEAPFGRFAGGVDQFGPQTTMRATADGAIAVAGGGVFASNLIPDSFAVVDTDKTAGVRVTNENRVVERSGPSGLVLVPDLRSYEANRVGIDEDDVPADSDIQTTQRVVRPQDRSGVVVKFPIHASQGALLRIIAPDNAAISVGSIASLKGSKEMTTIGYNGETFMRDLSPHNVVNITRPDGSTCQASFNYHPARGAIPRIGPITCRPAAVR